MCSNCGTANEAGRKFCGECASPLVASALPAPPPVRAGPSTSGEAPVAELRLVSILFADLVGFTTLAKGRDAEDTRELLSRYFISRLDAALPRSFDSGSHSATPEPQSAPSQDFPSTTLAR